MSNFDLFNDLKIFLPKYLSEEQLEKLFSELEDFPKNIDKRFYSRVLKRQPVFFQGDGFSEVPIADYVSCTFRQTKGFLLSNSCDISPDNKRIYNTYLSFVPLFDLIKWKEVLLEEGHEENRINNHIRAIKEQKVTSFFFLPKTDGLVNDCFARFDCVFSIGSSKKLNEKLFKGKFFTLSNYGFYMLLFKISVHFTRVQERFDRDQE